MPGNTSRKLRVDRMRRNLARNVPDAVQRDFDRTTFHEGANDFVQWREWFIRMMKLKYPNEPRSIHVAIDPLMRIDYNEVRVWIECRPKRGPHG